MALEVVVPAVCRPNVWYRSIKSFCRYVADPSEFVWYVNVDPVGDGTMKEMRAVAEDYGMKVWWHTPDRPSLNAALKWLWQMPVGEVFLHLEDDVEFLRPVDLSAVRAEFDCHDRLAKLNIPRPGFPKDSHLVCETDQAGPIAWRSGGFRMNFGPGLVSSEFAGKAMRLLRMDLNPESQFHKWNDELVAWEAQWRYATYGKPEDGRAVHDIGRGARKKTGWRKGQDETGMIWERTE